MTLDYFTFIFNNQSINEYFNFFAVHAERLKS